MREKKPADEALSVHPPCALRRRELCDEQCKVARPPHGGAAPPLNSNAADQGLLPSRLPNIPACRSRLTIEGGLHGVRSCHTTPTPPSVGKVWHNLAKGFLKAPSLTRVRATSHEPDQSWPNQTRCWQTLVEIGRCSARIRRTSANLVRM